MAGLVPFNRRSNDLSSLGAGDFYNMLDDFFSDNWFPSRSLSGDTFKLDVKETDTAYIIEAELPGVNKEDVDLDLNNDYLTISVKREECANDEKDNYVHRERKLCSMSRSIHMQDARFEDTNAKMDNGILTITVAKKTPVAASTKINID